MICIIEFKGIWTQLYIITNGEMKGIRIVKQIGFVLVGSLISITHLNAQDSTAISEDEESQETTTVAEVKKAIT